jgi:hypothetical protein
MRYPCLARLDHCRQRPIDLLHSRPAGLLPFIACLRGLSTIRIARATMRPDQARSGLVASRLPIGRHELFVDVASRPKSADRASLILAGGVEGFPAAFLCRKLGRRVIERLLRPKPMAPAKSRFLRFWNSITGYLSNKNINWRPPNADDRGFCSGAASAFLSVR